MINSIKKICIVFVALSVVFLLNGCKKEGAHTEEKKPPILSKQTTKSEDGNYDAHLDLSTEDYETIIKENFKGFDGKCSYAFHLYNGDKKISNGNQKMKSASVIKLFIMEYAYDCIVGKKVSSDTMIKGVSLKDHIDRMITVSDNTSTNVLIDYFSIERINDFFAKCNYNDTVLGRKMLDTSAAKRGQENYTSCTDVMAFLDKLYENQDVYPYDEMLGIMKRQTIATKLRRDMPPDIEMASKTGELSDTQNDVAIVFSPGGDFAIVCLTENGNSATAINAMAVTCRQLYDILQK